MLKHHNSLSDNTNNQSTRPLSNEALAVMCGSGFPSGYLDKQDCTTKGRGITYHVANLDHWGMGDEEELADNSLPQGAVLKHYGSKEPVWEIPN